MTIEAGLLEQVYLVEENPTYGALETPIATDGIRHRSCNFTGANNREPSDERTGFPGRAQSLPRRHTAGGNIESRWEPSGTLGVASYAALLLRGALGSTHTANLATTVNAAPSPTATGCTLISATGLAVGDVMWFTVGGIRQATRIKTISTLAVTYDALSAAPDVPGAAVSGVNYGLASTMPYGLSALKYWTGGGFKEAVSGFLPDALTITIDGTTEALLAASGPASRYYPTGSVPAKPASHTTVGNPIGGLVGNFYLAGTAFLITRAVVEIRNAMWLRNNELGTSYASGFQRQNFRDVRVQVSFNLEDTALLTAGHNTTQQVLRLALGSTNGSMLGLVLPKVEFEIPPVQSQVGPVQVTASGMAYHTSGNDEIFVAEG